MDDRDPRGEQSQFDEGEFAQNAGDSLAKPQEDNPLITMPGEKKQVNSKKASTLQALRLVEAYIASGVLTEAQKYNKIAEYERKTALEVDSELRAVELMKKATREVSSPRTVQRIANRMPSMAQAPVVKTAGLDSVDDGLLFD